MTSNSEAQIYSLEYSRHSDENGMYPFHIGPLWDAVKHNLSDFYHNNRGENKWQIIYIGDIKDCYKLADRLMVERPLSQMEINP